MKKSGRILIACLLAVILVLSCVLAGVSVSYRNYRDKTSPANTQEPNSGSAQGTGADEIDLEVFKQYAQQYNVSMEFLQRFFDDTIVFKADGKIRYEPIDPALVGNDLDWNNLSVSDGEIEYLVDGQSEAHKVIDVSTHQGEIDWTKVKADGVDTAFIRLGYRGWGTGKIVLDAQYQRNMEEAAKAGVEIGVYFFSQAITPDEAREEAAFVLESLKGYSAPLPIVFDVEKVTEGDGRANHLTAAERTDITVAFCEAIEKAGKTPMIYANAEGFFYDMEFSKLAKYDIWFAQHFKRPFFPYELRMWQYSADGTVDGIEGGVDMNLCFVDCVKK